MEYKPSFTDDLYLDVQPSYSDSLMHHGIKGMKWGVRRYQDKNGRTTKAGKAHRKKMSKKTKEKLKTAAAIAATAALYGGTLYYANKISKEENAKREQARKQRQKQWNDFQDQYNRYQQKQQEYRDYWNQYARQHAGVNNKADQNKYRAQYKNYKTPELAKQRLDEAIRRAAEGERNGGMDIDMVNEVKSARIGVRKAREKAK